MSRFCQKMILKNLTVKKEWSQHHARWVGPDVCKQEKLETKILGSLHSQASELLGRLLPGNYKLFGTSIKTSFTDQEYV